MAISAVLVGFFAVTVSAFAFGLSDEDYDYLKTQHIERSDAPILDLSPKERQRVHNLINDPSTANDPTARNASVKDALALFLEHQLSKRRTPVNCGTRQRSHRPAAQGYIARGLSHDANGDYRRCYSQLLSLCHLVLGE